MTNSNPFPLLSGHLSLDLVNTEVVRRGVRQNLLTSKEDLKEWIKIMHENDSLIPEHFSSETEEWLEQALDTVLNFRAFLRDGFERMTDGYQLSNDWLGQLEKFIAKAPFIYRMIGEKLVQIPIGEPVDRFLSLIALDALHLYANGELGTMKKCANPDCVLLFMDSSGRRKWCSMQICGNRKKVARFQKRSGKKES